MALGSMSIFSSFFGGYAAFGSIPRSSVVDAAGQKSNLATLFTAGFVAVAILFIMPFFEKTPKVDCQTRRAPG